MFSFEKGSLILLMAKEFASYRYLPGTCNHAVTGQRFFVLLVKIPTSETWREVTSEAAPSSSSSSTLVSPPAGKNLPAAYPSLIPFKYEYSLKT